MPKEKTTSSREGKYRDGNMREQVCAGLQELLGKPGKNILFAGVGNVLKRDDGVGVYITREIHPGNGTGKLTVEMGIENHIGKIKSLAPDILVIIDAVDFCMQPGYSRLAKATELQEITTNTHNISLSKISELFDMPVYIMGIQPSDISFGEDMSQEVRETAAGIIQVINSKSRKNNFNILPAMI